jgi:hypothetical protein
MKTVIAAACLAALAGIMLLIAVGPRAGAGSPETVEFSELPEAASPPNGGRAEAYDELHALRMQRIADLEIYAAAGVFPENLLTAEFTPVFVDYMGTACAVGHLMRCSGANALVDQIAAENNLVKLHELTDGPAVEWMLRSGLTKEECELIQPEYNWRHNPMIEPKSNADIARLFIRSRLDAVARKLRKDTPASLQIALSRLGGEFEMLEPAGATTRIFRNDGESPLMARVSTLDASGRIEAKSKWREVAPGASFTLETKGSRVLVETQVAATL